MNTDARAARTPTGRPLFALAGLVACWIGARVALWDLPAPLQALERDRPWLLEQETVPRLSVAGSGIARIVMTAPVAREIALARIVLPRGTVPVRATGRQVLSDPAAAPDSIPGWGNGSINPTPKSPQSLAVAHAAGTGAVDRVLRPAPLPKRGRRWSADLWVALRGGRAPLSAGGLAAPVYGASQAGAVLRFRLASASRHDPAVYARAVHALDRREGDLATGLAARIAPGIPVTAHVEVRASDRGGNVVIRPATFLAAGVDEVPLPLDFRVRGYAQAGYVGGRDGTAFADGSIAAERSLLRRSQAAFFAGAGLWGGAQRGAARLDAGPSAGLRFPVGEGSARLAVDYRVRMAGNAAPASGVAVTLSAGF